MIKFVAGLLMAAVTIPQPTRFGRWLDTTEDMYNDGYFVVGGGGDFIMSEDYEVVKTHEICASVDGFYFEKSDTDRYDVRFKGMRTSATFTFTDRHIAEKWAEKWCTPESLLSITAGRGTMKRDY